MIATDDTWLLALMGEPDVTRAARSLFQGSQDTAPRSAIIATTTRKAAPFYYRCEGCLTVFTTEDRTPEKTVCGCGGTRIEFLGQAQRDRLVRTEDACPCDARCTNAQGPNCNCKCGGTNHGSQLLVTISIDCGPVPVVKLQKPIAAKRTREEWENGLAAAHSRMSAKWGGNLSRYRMREWIDRSAWIGIRDDYEALAKAKTYRTHARRMKALCAI